MNFSRIDWTAPAAKIVKAVAGKASREETTCGSGKMVWHCWKGPPDQTPLVFLHGGCMVLPTEIILTMNVFDVRTCLMVGQVVRTKNRNPAEMAGTLSCIIIIIINSK